MAKQTFTAGQTLTAAQMNDLQTNDFNWTVSTQTANYTLQAADKGTREVMNMGSAGTVTVPNSTFNAGDIVWVHSIGSGTISIVAGSGMTLNSSAGTAPTLAQWEGGVVYFTSASSSIFFRGGGGVTVPSTVEWLVIGGGGGGGNCDGASFSGGGGGAGGYRSGILGESSGGGNTGGEQPFSITSGVTYTVTVGGGGGSNTAGTDSSISGTGLTTITSTGGGRGGGTNAPSIGGSGGGGRSGATQNGAAGTTNQGFAGGNGGALASQGGGGGGAGGAGTTGTAGIGVASLITGSSVTRGVGGPGAAANPPTDGAVNTGNGGQGRSVTNAAGASGGKGIVVIRQLISQKFPSTLTGGTSSQNATHYIFTFNDSGTIGWS